MRNALYVREAHASCAAVYAVNAHSVAIALSMHGRGHHATSGVHTLARCLGMVIGVTLCDARDSLRAIAALAIALPSRAAPRTSAAFLTRGVGAFPARAQA